MKLRLFPQENAGLDLLSRMAAQAVRGTATLSEALGADPSEFARLAEELHAFEAETTDLHFALMTQMRTSFINPLPREDLYDISLILLSLMERLDSAAEIISLYRLTNVSGRAAEQLEVLGRQAELSVAAMRTLASMDDLEDYWIEMLRLSKRVERTHRMWLAELIHDHKALAYIRHRDLADQLAAASKEFRRLGTYVGNILVRES